MRAAPMRYVAELIRTDTDSKRASRWLIALMVLCCDPLAIALTPAPSVRRQANGASGIAAALSTSATFF